MRAAKKSFSKEWGVGGINIVLGLKYRPLQNKVYFLLFELTQIDFKSAGLELKINATLTLKRIQSGYSREEERN
jgi:hypothetical protein